MVGGQHFMLLTEHTCSEDPLHEKAHLRPNSPCCSMTWTDNCDKYSCKGGQSHSEAVAMRENSSCSIAPAKIEVLECFLTALCNRYLQPSA